MVAFRLVDIKHSGKVAKTLAAAQLPDHQREQLMTACEMIHLGIPTMRRHNPPELEVIKIFHYLRKNVFVLVHLQPPLYGYKDTHSNCYDQKIQFILLIFK